MSLNNLNSISGRLRKIGISSVEFFRAVSKDLRRRSGPEDVQGLSKVVGGPRPQRRVHGFGSHRQKDVNYI